jgi:hypothetical protein
MFLIGEVSPRDAALFDGVNVQSIPEDKNLPNAFIDRIRASVTARPRTRPSRTTISG